MAETIRSDAVADDEWVPRFLSSLYSVEYGGHATPRPIRNLLPTGIVRSIGCRALSYVDCGSGRVTRRMAGHSARAMRRLVRLARDFGFVFYGVLDVSLGLSSDRANSDTQRVVVNLCAPSTPRLQGR